MQTTIIERNYYATVGNLPGFYVQIRMADTPQGQTEALEMAKAAAQEEGFHTNRDTRFGIPVTHGGIRPHLTQAFWFYAPVTHQARLDCIARYRKPASGQ